MTVEAPAQSAECVDVAGFETGIDGILAGRTTGESKDDDINWQLFRSGSDVVRAGEDKAGRRWYSATISLPVSKLTYRWPAGSSEPPHLTIDSFAIETREATDWDLGLLAERLDDIKERATKLVARTRATHKRPIEHRPDPMKSHQEMGPQQLIGALSGTLQAMELSWSAVRKFAKRFTT